MRNRSAAVLLALVVATLSGCVQMPDSGPVVESQSEGGVDSGSSVYRVPKPPQAGDTRPDVVRGFLAAMQAIPIQTNTAREFLTQEASASWAPQDETITYAVPPTPRETGSSVAITLTEPDHLDSRGAWQGALPPGRRTITFPMLFENGEWRIDQAPDALIVPETWFEQNYRQVSLYFFDPTATMLAPQPVHVPRGEALASTLTRGLLMGPGEGMDRVMQSFIPRGLKVAVGVAVSDDGIADIPLTGDAGELTPSSIELMMAQFAWTLRQDPAIEGIRVSIDGAPVPLPGGVSSYSVDGGAEYDPAGFQASPLLYALRDGLVVFGAGLDEVSGPFGTEDQGIRSIGIDLEADRVAAVADKGASVLVGPLASSDRGKVRAVASGTDFLPPAWDFSDRIWLIDRTKDGARVRYVDDDRVSALDVPGITGRTVRMFIVSRDGTRILAVVRGRNGDSLVVARIEHGSSGRVVGALHAERISDEGEVQLPIRAMSWHTPTSIAVLSPFPQRLSQVRLAAVDGSPVGQDSSSAIVEEKLRSLAGSPAEDQATYGVTVDSLIDIFVADRRTIPLGDGVSSVTYVG